MIKGYQKTKSKKGVTLGFASDIASSKPTLYLTDKDLPELKDWETGKTYKLDITVKQVSKSERDTGNGKEMTGTFDITDVKVDNDDDNNQEEDD